MFALPINETILRPGTEACDCKHCVGLASYMVDRIAFSV